MVVGMDIISTVNGDCWTSNLLELCGSYVHVDLVDVAFDICIRMGEEFLTNYTIRYVHVLNFMLLMRLI